MWHCPSDIADYIYNLSDKFAHLKYWTDIFIHLKNLTDFKYVSENKKRKKLNLVR